MAIFLAVTFAPTTLLLVFAMLPTAIAAVVDGDRKKNMTLAIGALNFAGTVPALLDLWARWNTIGGAIEMIRSAHPWQLPYAGATVGWILCLLVPPLTARVVQNTISGRLGQLEERGRMLRDVWGEDADPYWVAQAAEVAPSQAHAEAVAAEMRAAEKAAA